MLYCCKEVYICVYMMHKLVSDVLVLIGQQSGMKGMSSMQACTEMLVGEKKLHLTFFLLSLRQKEECEHIYNDQC